MRIYLHLSFVLFAIVLVACAPASQGPVAGSEADTAAVAEEIEALEAQYSSAITSGDVEAILAVYSDEGAHLVPNQPAIVGKGALRTLWEERFAQNDYETTPLVEGVRVSGDLAVSRIRMNGTLTPRDGSEPGLINLKGITVWERQSDGSWKRLWSIYNSNTPPAAPPETS
jgi:ketosteroid isomerase-like protein